MFETSYLNSVEINRSETISSFSTTWKQNHPVFETVELFHVFLSPFMSLNWRQN